ncbi:MAG: hypothetical protein RLZZ69_1571 [Cyanobacteriota bacterium]
MQQQYISGNNQYPQANYQLQPVQNERGETVPLLVSQGLTTVDTNQYFQQYQALLAGFQPNVDFRIIPSKKSKQSVALTKAGAERLCCFFGLNYRLVPEPPHLDFTNNIFYYSYQCELYLAGNLVGNGYGNCNNRESKYASLYSPDILNTLDKMAQKRAFIGAVLFTTGGSRFFGQKVG